MSDPPAYRSGRHDQQALTLTEQALVSGARELKLSSPYLPAFPPRARLLGGRWHEATKTWRFDLRDSDRVRNLCLELFGRDPLAAEPAELVSVRVDPAEAGWSAKDRRWYRYGQEIASRPDGAKAVELGSGVIVLRGGFERISGFRNHPELRPLERTILEIRDVPRSLVTDGPGVWIVDEPAPDRVGSALRQVQAIATVAGPAERRAMLLSILGLMGAAERGEALAEIAKHTAQAR